MTIVCEDTSYSVVFTKNGSQLSITRPRLLSINFERVVDDVSVATIQYVIGDISCCDDLGLIDHLNTKVDIGHGNARELMWRGSVLTAEYERNSGMVTIRCVDDWHWSKIRLVKGAKSFTGDVGEFLEQVYNESVGSVDSPDYNIVRYPSTQTGTFEIEDKPTFVWNAFNQYLQQGLDVTSYANSLVIGVNPTPPITIYSKDVIGNYSVIKDGEVFANRIIADVDGSIQGVYPSVQPTGNYGYPLVEAVITDSTITSQAGADNAAKSRYDFSARGVRRISTNGGLMFSQSSGINARRLMAGQIVNFIVDDLCFEVKESFRIGRLSFDIKAGREIIDFDLQPIGTYDS